MRTPHIRLALAPGRRAVLEIHRDVEGPELRLQLERLADELLGPGEVLARRDDREGLLAAEQGLVGADHADIIDKLPPRRTIVTNDVYPSRMPTILVIEDEADLREVLDYNLRQAGHEVLLAGRASDGLRAARQEHPDLVLLDLMLPDRPGSDVCRELRAD